jgi:hypothetical protein
MRPTRDHVHRQFRHIGARARFTNVHSSGAISLRVRRDRRGQYFDVRLPSVASTAVLNADKIRRHLLLIVSVDGDQSRYVFGHDNRRWYVASVDPIRE